MPTMPTIPTLPTSPTIPTIGSSFDRFLMGPKEYLGFLTDIAIIDEESDFRKLTQLKSLLLTSKVEGLPAGAEEKYSIRGDGGRSHLYSFVFFVTSSLSSLSFFFVILLCHLYPCCISSPICVHSPLSCSHIVIT